MSMVFKASGKSGDYVKASLAPVNHNDDAHFGLLDSVVVTVLMLCVSGLVYLLLRGAGL